jgi:cephalosporin hydroxylase
MRIIVDTDARELVDDGGQTMPLYSPEAFAALSRLWVQVGWTQRYSYQFTWLGRPIVQLPEDLVRVQEVIHQIQPDVIVETGVAHGGSLVFYASLCQALGRGRVIGVDIEIRPENRAAIESHPLAHRVALIEGSSTDPKVVRQVRAHIRDGEKVLVLLDSCHSRDHVLRELEAYAPLVSPGSYVIATDGIMGDLAGLPRAPSQWAWDNPRQAALEFARRRTDYSLEEPSLLFNESSVTNAVTYWPSAYLRKIA